jgi:hypothetical protein
VHTIGVAQRRARLGVRHHLAAAARAADPVQAAAGVVALHATDPATVFLSVRSRTGTGPAGGAADPQAIERALYEQRSLIRLLGMRRTMFVVPVQAAPVVQAAATRAIAAQLRRRYTQLLQDSGAGDGVWLKDVEESTARALARRGEATGAELAADEPRLRTQVKMAEGKSYGAAVNITSWVLMLLAADGRIVRGRPRGTWASSQWRWSPVQAWLPAGMADLPADAARAELLRCWLAAFGPGTLADMRWWTGWTAGHVRAALAAVAAVEVGLDGGGTGWLLPGDTDPVAAPEPWVALLPALDPTAMGWQERSWYLGEHREALFDRSGNIGPTVWCDGRIVGGWAQRGDGEVAFRLLADIGTQASAAVAAEAGRLAGWIGPVRITPRFRTPLERELSR